MGLTSFGPPRCGGRDEELGIYTKISEFERWIKSRGSIHDQMYQSESHKCDGYEREDFMCVQSSCIGNADK